MSYLLQINNMYDPEAPQFEAHLFATEAEAQDYAEVYIMSEDTAVVYETEISISKTPPCFQPNELVVVHEPRER